MAAVSYRLLRLTEDPADGVEYFKSFGESLSGIFTNDISEAYLFPSFTDFVHAATVLWLSNGPADLSFEPVYLMG